SGMPPRIAPPDDHSMTRNAFFLTALACMAGFTTADGGVLTYNLKSYSQGNYRATFLHSAGQKSGATPTAAAMTGYVSKSLTGSFDGTTGMVSGDKVLTGINGSLAGKTGALDGSGRPFASGLDRVDISFLDGGMRFFQDGKVGGWLQYSFTASDTTNVAPVNSDTRTGTFFFLNDTYVGTAPGLPNQGSRSQSFALWGNNWQHDAPSGAWDFLSGIGYTGPMVAPKANDRWGIDIFAEIDPSTPDSDPVPEPMSLAVWGLMVGGLAASRTRRLRRC
ncbi:MAG: hypothetical protein AAGA03_15590, partial [Planctomycetota bacterium]